MNLRYDDKDTILLKYLEGRLEKNPSSSFFAMLSHYYLETDKIAEALSVAQRGVVAHPNYSTGHIVLAMAMMKARLFYDARKELAKAADLNPESQIIQSLSTTLDKQEQTDEIGKKLADQFNRNRADGKDLMNTIEDTINAYRQKEQSDDFIIPGLDSIIGGEQAKLSPQLKTPTSLSSQTEKSVEIKNHGGEQGLSESIGKGESASTIARAIIEKVAREVESGSANSSETKKSDDSLLPNRHGSDMPQEPSSSKETHSEIIDSNQSSLNSPDSSQETNMLDEIERSTGDFDLDSLARELETAGPIKPSDNQPRDRSDESGLDLTPEIVTETLAKIFEQQGQLKTAIEAYNILIQKKPELSETYQKKIAELTKRTNG